MRGEAEAEPTAENGPPRAARRRRLSITPSLPLGLSYDSVRFETGSAMTPNGELRETFVRWYPGMRTDQETNPAKKAA
jgi:hypothetical protein